MTNFRVNDPPLLLTEAQFQWNAKKGDPVSTASSSLAAGVIGRFDSERFDAKWAFARRSATSGTPARFAGDYGIYGGLLEQKIFRVQGEDDRGIGVFARASYSPPDRNLIDVYADGGFEFVGLADTRPHDKFGVAVAYAHVSRLGKGAGSRLPVPVRTQLACADV